MKQQGTLNLLAALFLLSNCLCKVEYPEGLWPLRIFGQFSDSPQQKILAYYDFNRDRYTDMLTQSYSYIAADQQLQPILQNNTMNLYIWNAQTEVFESKTKVELGPLSIESVLVTDFDQDAKIDLVISSQQFDGRITTMLYSAVCIGWECAIRPKSEFSELITISSNYPTVLQIQSQNVLVFAQEGVLKAKVYSNIKKDLVEHQFSMFIDAGTSQCTNYEKLFYLDYNGDCIQDIVIEEDDKLYFYFGKQGGQFSFQNSVSIASQHEQPIDVGIKDINFDGLPDILILLYHLATQAYSFQIHYNTAVKSVSVSCAITDPLLTFPYDFVAGPEELIETMKQISRMPISLDNSQGEADQKYIIRLGDINNDGFADVIVDGPRRASLFINKHCTEKCGSFGYNGRFEHSWSIFRSRMFESQEISDLGKLNGPLCSMSFFDFYDDGRLDIIANECPTRNQLHPLEQSGRITPIVNSLLMDAFFMKIIVLENFQDQAIKDSQIDYQDNANGAHVDMYVTSLSGELIPAGGDQYSNPGVSLELPFLHFGLGRTNNYVEHLTVAMNRKKGVQKKMWTPIVPNSQLIIVPGPNHRWSLQAFISPTAVMAVVFWFVLLTLTVMGVVIAHLSRKQKIEDKENEDSFYSILR